MKLVFIIGTGRCGSTLLSEIFAKHIDSSFFSRFEEMHRGRLGKLGKWSSEMYRNEHSPVLSGYFKKFRPTEAYSLIRSRVSPIYVQPARDLNADDVTPWLKNRFREFFLEKYGACKKPVLLHKYTGWSRLAFFAEIFPEAKFVHVVRDGRAVANSWLQMPWWTGYQGPEQWLWGPLNESESQVWRAHNESFVALAGLCWLKLIASYEQSTQVLPSEQYLQIRYEDFIKSPHSISKKVLEHIELEWSEDFQKQLETFSINSSRAQAYRQDLSDAQQEQLTTVISTGLTKYGYEQSS